MGITGELVRSVFSKTRSAGNQESNVRNNVVDKKKWISIKSYLCGDEFNSVLAEEDSASVKSSEATVTQPISDYLTDELEMECKETKEELPEEDQSLFDRLAREDEAAIIIQSAFRGFLVRRKTDVKQSNVVANKESPSRESVGTSLEVQTANSMEVFTVLDENASFHHRMQQKARAQVLKLKDEWDDSTVSSNISRMRIQNRLEATTRRERALAYAFSQQLRICSKRKQTKSDGTEPSMGWSWLERWMATRLPENYSGEEQRSKQLEPIASNERWAFGKNLFDVSREEKESCGSNEVPVQIDSFSVTATKEKGSSKPAKNRLKATRSLSKCKSVPSSKRPKEHNKVSKKEFPKEPESDKKHKGKQAASKGEIKCKDSLISNNTGLVTSNHCELGP